MLGVATAEGEKPPGPSVHNFVDQIDIVAPKHKQIQPNQSLVSSWTNIGIVPRLIAYIANNAAVVVFGIIRVSVGSCVVVPAIVIRCPPLAVGVVVVAVSAKRVLLPTGASRIGIAASISTVIVVVRAHPIHLWQVNTKILPKPLIAQDTNSVRFPSDVHGNVSHLPRKRKLPDGRLRAAAGANMFVAWGDRNAPGRPGQPDRIAASLASRVVRARQNVAPCVLAQGDLSFGVPFSAKRASKNLDVPTLGSTGKRTRRMGTLKTGMVHGSSVVVVTSPKLCRWVGVALGANVVSVALVAIAPSDCDYLEVTNRTQKRIVVVVSFLFCLWVKLSLAGHDITLLARLAKQHFSRNVIVVSTPSPPTASRSLFVF